ncbi:MAG TPA: ATP-binding protein [Phycisphaerae bacterium]|nr:ATP-binding protein [Phycisphaerae bacterium]
MPPESRQDGFERLGQDARRSFLMAKDGEPITPELDKALIGELQDWRRDHTTKDGRPMSWKRLAELIGGKDHVPHSTLSEIVSGKYKGDRNKYLRMIDRFLAEDRERAGRFDVRQHAEIGLTRKIFGVIRATIRNNSMSLIVGEPGAGKSVHGRGFAADRGGVIVICPDETFNNARGVSHLLCQGIDGLRNMLQKPHPKRLAAVQSYFRQHRNLVIVVDECQQLTAEGLTCLRNLHDKSDPEGQRCTPIIFFGDEHFYRLLVKSRNGERSPIAPQLTRRIFPVFDIKRDGADDDGNVFTVEDIVRIIRNERVRVVTSDGTKWLTRLANVHGWGSLGFAIAVLRMAFDISTKIPIDVPELVAALRMSIGPRAMEEVDEAAGGELLQKAV